jgi:outer membrane receptor for ferrienterochelin and colicins
MKMEIPVVEAASKYTQKTTEAPATVTIIGADEVKKNGYRTLSDILAAAPGFYTTYDRNYSYLGVRGFNLGDFYTRNSRVLVMVDGHRINNSLTDGAAIGTDFIFDPDLIDRVEIIRGPGSSLYGNNAFLGVINVITRRGRDMAGNGVISKHSTSL